MKIGAARRKAAICLAAALLTAAAVFLLWPMDVRGCLEYGRSGEIRDRKGGLLYIFLADDGQWRFERDVKALGPRIVQATVAAEDQRFYRHCGVDPIAVMRAAYQNLRHGRIRSGASTITMQVAKRAGGTRSPAGKLMQAGRALRLERHAEKDEILSAYLNTAPYGLNLSGAEAASRRYFGKPAVELTLPEAALLAALPKAPSALMPLTHGDRARDRRNYVLARMRDEGYITAAECDAASASPLGAAWHEFPQQAPHVAMWYRENARNGTLALTLDGDVQASVERFLHNARKRYGGQIGNAAVVVASVPDANVLARAGSMDFYGGDAGQVDATRAARSPGSALKPFTYALAMENNALYPGEMLLDDTLDYGLYDAQNFDAGYTGLVSASYALGHSLNVPAVTTLNRVGLEPVYQLLHRAGLTTLSRPADHYGLGLTLGSCEVRLDELAAAYCTLANLGEYRPLRERADAPVREPLRLLSRGVCLKVYEMLEQSLPDEFDRDLVRPEPVARACWKTGTSSGHRDAWAFVFNAQYVVGVWMGNNDGRSSPTLVGIRTALPLAAKIFRSLPASTESAWPRPENDLVPVRICSVSGLPVSKWCAKSETATLPRVQFLNRICDVHYPAGDGSARERWPGSARNWDLARVTAPRAADGAEPREESLRILDPPQEAQFVLTGEPMGDRLRLRSSLDDRGRVSWYIDDIFLGTSAPDAPVFLDLAAGEHVLACMNERGGVEQVKFSVAAPEEAARWEEKGG